MECYLYNPGGGVYFAALLGSDNSCTTPLENLALIRGVVHFSLHIGQKLKGSFYRGSFSRMGASCYCWAQKKGATERGVFAFACQYIVSPRGQTGNRTVTQMQHPLLVEGRPNCARQSLASTLSTSRRGDIVLRSRSPRKCHYPLFAYTLFKRAQEVQTVGIFSLQNSSVSVHNVHFMVYARLIFLRASMHLLDSHRVSLVKVASSVPNKGPGP